MAASYPLAAVFWPSEGYLVVRDLSGQRLLTFPVSFLRSGWVDNFAYVVEQLVSAFEEDGLLCWPDGRSIGQEEGVHAGEVVFHRKDGSRDPCTPRRGPRFKYRYRAPNHSDDRSTMSNSKRSSANQSAFREYLIYRDGECLLSETVFKGCTAAHILPMSRPEYYTEVLGFDPGPFLYQGAYGILLRDDLHHSHDRGEWALYPRNDDEVIVHVFEPASPYMVAYHGKVINLRTRLRGPRDQWPDTRLLRFHYQQCAIKHLRGYSAGMHPPPP
ncbi:unnamed protein product [Jaminaea pallidilutea]